MQEQREQIRASFTRAVQRPDKAIGLFNACLLIAAEEYPDLPFKKYLGRVSQFAGMVTDRLPSGHSMYDVLHFTSDVLFDLAGLKGNSDNYYDPRNSYVNDVLDRGLGIPITLSVVYAEVARRAGVKMQGIGMPGHFLLRATDGPHEIFVDPYHRGGLLSRKECLSLALRGRAAPDNARSTLARRLLPTHGNRSILRRLLTNLKLTYARQRDYKRALRASERIQLLDPDNWRNLSDLARLQAEVGEFMNAVGSLSAFLDRAPQSADTKRAEDALKQLKQLASRKDTSNSTGA